ncbi:MAG: hypothetical protein QOJ98_1389 [Acidobacteriota bacterium]|nr:hypothetical protein [Acidobacteriota bacterium]
MRLTLLLLFLLLACSRTTIDRTEWQSMSHDDRVLFVRTMIAEEQAKDAKGGNGRPVTRTAEEYVTMIDAAYARGEQQQPEQLFAELAR